jgi:hypothetical protein
MKTTLSALLAAVICVAAQAHQPYTTTECHEYGSLVYLTAVARDMHLDAKEVAKAVALRMQQSHFVADEADQKVVYKALGIIYNHPEIPPDDLRTMAEEQCAKYLTSDSVVQPVSRVLSVK